MSSTKEKNKVLSVIAPLSGKVVALEQVPDPVFAEKALGEGAAIIPESGKIYSPVDGEVASVAATQHAFGFSSTDGLDVLVHVGLETVALNGEGFTVHVKEGDKVKAGDLVAEVDLKFLERRISGAAARISCLSSRSLSNFSFNFLIFFAERCFIGSPSSQLSPLQ